MSRAISMKSSQFMAARVAGQLTYTPAYTNAGKKVNSRVVIPVYCNSHRGTNQRTGETGRSDSFKFIAWGKLADVCVKSLPKGKAIDVVCDPHSYLGDLYNADGSKRLDAAGQVIQVTKVAFTIKDIIFGEESSKLIAEEIATGRRPQNWNVANHQDYALWTTILQQRQAIVWNGVDKSYGYARVYIPQGPGIQLDFSQSTPVAPATVAPVAPATVAPVAPAAGAAGAPDVAAITAAVIASMNAAPVSPAAPVVPFVQEQGTNMPLF